jgi:hypothetical protein
VVLNEQKKAQKLLSAGCTITSNTATTGGGIYQASAGGSMTIQSSIITRNTATEDAGGIYIDRNAGSTTLTSLLSGTSTTVTVQSVLYFAAGETIQIDNEQMTVTNVDALHNTLTVLRGVNQTTVAAHGPGVRVIALSTHFDAFTAANLMNNSAPSNAQIDGCYLTGS